MDHPLLNSFAKRAIGYHDQAIHRIEMASASDKSAVLQPLHALHDKLARLSPEARQLVLECARMVAGDVLAGVLFTISELADSGEWSIVIDGKPLSELTPGLHYELFGDEEDWMHRFSKYGGD